MKIEGPIDVYGPFDEAGPGGPPSGGRRPLVRIAIMVEELRDLLARLPEESQIGLPLAKGATLRILDHKGHYLGFINLARKEIKLVGQEAIRGTNV